VTTVVVTTSYPRHADDVAGCFVRAAVLAHLRAGRRVAVFAAGEPTVFDREEAQRHEGRVAITRVPFPRGVPLFYGAGAPECLEAEPLRASLAALGYWGALVTALRDRLQPADASPRVAFANFATPARAIPPEIPPDVESHWLVPSALAVAAIGHRGVHTAHAHSGDIALLERVPGGDALARWLLRAPIRLVFASADLRDRFERLVNDRAHAEVIRSAEVTPASSLLLEHLQSARRAAANPRLPSCPPTRRPIVLSVGRLVPIKGHDRLLRAVGRLPRARRPEVVILGAGPEGEGLRRRAAALDVALTLPGQVSAREVEAWLGRATVFVHAARRLPSGRVEGTPVAVREAHAAGLPVIAVASGGLSALSSSSPLRASLRLLPDGDDAGVVSELRTALAEALDTLRVA
jgi:glycosyltransferase involved in cell wall biosynthesis